jgi:hypothetical protein
VAVRMIDGTEQGLDHQEHPKYGHVWQDKQKLSGTISYQQGEAWLPAGGRRHSASRPLLAWNLFPLLLEISSLSEGFSFSTLTLSL